MSTPNADMRAHWNERSGPNWVALQPRLDGQLAPVTDALLEGLPLAAGQSALDVGCGTGALTLSLAERVGPTGAVTAVDLSAPMLKLARERVAAGGFAQVTCLEADAQVAPFADGGFDAVVSRFGVMFFDDPAAAFANLLRATRPGGALRFMCWQAAARNPWVTLPMRVARPILGELPMAPPRAPGPFALCDAEYLREILGAAGWTELSIEPWERSLVLGGTASLDEAADFALVVGPLGGALREATADQRAAVREALAPALAAHLTPEGVRLDAAMWRVNARRAE